MISFNEDIDRKLREILRPGHPSRPFLCTGSPEGCQVALVGINPGTATPFERYWSVERGCDKNGWLMEYFSDPRNRRKPTRRRIEILLQELHPVRCIELNISPYYSRNEKDLPSDLKKDERVFDLLLRMVKPRLLFAYGCWTIKVLTRRFERPLPKKQYTLCHYEKMTFEVYADYHLSSRGIQSWSDQRVQELGCALKARLHARNS